MSKSIVKLPIFFLLYFSLTGCDPSKVDFKSGRQTYIEEAYIDLIYFHLLEIKYGQNWTEKVPIFKNTYSESYGRFSRNSNLCTKIQSYVDQLYLQCRIAQPFVSKYSFICGRSTNCLQIKLSNSIPLEAKEVVEIFDGACHYLKFLKASHKQRSEVLHGAFTSIDHIEYLMQCGRNNLISSGFNFDPKNNVIKIRYKESN